MPKYTVEVSVLRINKDLKTFTLTVDAEDADSAESAAIAQLEKTERKIEMKIGDIVKVSLPGESPFAEVVSLLSDGKWIGRIDNHLIATDPDLRREFAKREFNSDRPLPQLHDWHVNDLIIFERHAEFPIWIPAQGQHGGSRA